MSTRSCKCSATTSRSPEPSLKEIYVNLGVCQFAKNLIHRPLVCNPKRSYKKLQWLLVGAWSQYTSTTQKCNKAFILCKSYGLSLNIANKPCWLRHLIMQEEVQTGKISLQKVGVQTNKASSIHAYCTCIRINIALAKATSYCISCSP